LIKSAAADSQANEVARLRFVSGGGEVRRPAGCVGVGSGYNTQDLCGIYLAHSPLHRDAGLARPGVVSAGGSPTRTKFLDFFSA